MTTRLNVGAHPNFLRDAMRMAKSFDVVQRRTYESANRFANLSWTHHLHIAARDDRLE